MPNWHRFEPSNFEYDFEKDKLSAPTSPSTHIVRYWTGSMEPTEGRLKDSSHIPEFLFPLFWDCHPETVEVERHADFVMGRIMERGSLEAMRWLRETYSKDQMTAFLEKRGKRTLSARELNYWSLITGISREKRADWVKESRGKTRVWTVRHAS